jgi:hypothetical protein
MRPSAPVRQLASAEGSLLLMSSSFGTLRGAVRNRDLPHAHLLQLGLVTRRVEPCVTGHQLWNAPELLFMILHCWHQQVRVIGPLLEHLIESNDLVLRFLNLNHLSKLSRLTRFTLADQPLAALRLAGAACSCICSRSCSRFLAASAHATSQNSFQAACAWRACSACSCGTYKARLLPSLR